mmetsp:Transcript_1076/g.3289  ORF Transcript_1076/g.3289 Transcript_1076/m.3289 type:complete len:265 (+) Transcript_1076:865-1659(+)
MKLCHDCERNDECGSCWSTGLVVGDAVLAARRLGDGPWLVLATEHLAADDVALGGHDSRDQAGGLGVEPVGHQGDDQRLGIAGGQVLGEDLEVGVPAVGQCRRHCRGNLGDGDHESRNTLHGGGLHSGDVLGDDGNDVGQGAQHGLKGGGERCGPQSGGGSRLDGIGHAHGHAGRQSFAGGSVGASHVDHGGGDGLLDALAGVAGRGHHHVAAEGDGVACADGGPDLQRPQADQEGVQELHGRNADACRLCNLVAGVDLLRDLS